MKDNFIELDDRHSERRHKHVAMEHALDNRHEKRRHNRGRFHYYCGLALIIGAFVAMAFQFRTSRILSYDMFTPVSSSEMSHKQGN